MHANNIHTFLSIHNGTPIILKTDSVDYVFTSKVIGMHRQWLIVDYDSALEGFADLLKPGIRFTVSFNRDGVYYQFTARWKRLILEPKPIIILSQPGPLENIERRKLFRIPCDLPGNMEVRRNIEMAVININVKGCRIRFASGSETINDFRKGDHVQLRIKIPDRHTGFIVKGEIREWHSIQNRIEAGILFHDPPNALIARIEKLKNDNAAI
jgi:hypothetical protein